MQETFSPQSRSSAEGTSIIATDGDGFAVHNTRNKAKDKQLQDSEEGNTTREPCCGQPCPEKISDCVSDQCGAEKNDRVSEDDASNYECASTEGSRDDVAEVRATRATAALSKFAHMVLWDYHTD